MKIGISQNEIYLFLFLKIAKKWWIIAFNEFFIKRINTNGLNLMKVNKIKLKLKIVK